MGWWERLLISLLEARNHRQGQELPHRGDSLYVGDVRAPYGQHGVTSLSLSKQERLRHIGVFGGTGGGKSVALLGWALKDVAAGRGFIFIDTHDSVTKLLHRIAKGIASGELPDDVARKVLLVDPANSAWTVGINPLSAETADEAYRQALAMSQVLKKVWPDVSWGARTDELTRNLLVLLAERGLSLADAEPLLRNQEELRAHAEQVENEECHNFFLYRYLTLSTNQQRVYYEPLLFRLTIFLSDPRIRAAIGSREADLDFRQAMDHGKWVLISLNRGQFMDNASLLGCFFLLSIQKAAFSRINIPERRRRMTTLMLEEFQTFAGSVTIEPFLNEGRKFGVGLMLVAQSPLSLEKRLWQSVRTNCANQVYFRLSPEDAKAVCSGFTGEDRELAMRQASQLITGNAMLLQSGKSPQFLSIPNLSQSGRITAVEQAIIDRIRRNVGRPMPPPRRRIGNRVTVLTTNRVGHGQDAEHGQTTNRAQEALDLPDGFFDGGEQ